jgi:sugar phosphate isomerase/epimerase
MIESAMQRILPTRRTAWQLLAAAPLAWQASAAERGMFLALNNVLISGRVPWPDFARLAAKVGYPGTDVMLKPAMKEGAGATRELLAGLKLRPAALDFPVQFRKEDAEFQAGMAALPDAAKFAAAVGCPRMVTYIMASSPTPKDELRALLKQRFTAAAKVLADYHVRLGLEFLGPLQLRKASKYEFIWRMNDMLEFAKECGPNVGLLLDIWHWHHAGATTQDIVNAGRERIVHVHFSDAPNLPPEQIRDNERLLPGEGIINTTGFLQALKKIGYRDALSIEVFGRGLKDMPPEQAAKLALDAADGTFKKAGIPTPWVHGR